MCFHSTTSVYRIAVESELVGIQRIHITPSQGDKVQVYFNLNTWQLDEHYGSIDGKVYQALHLHRAFISFSSPGTNPQV